MASKAPQLSQRLETLEVFVELLSEMDGRMRARDFYNRLCEALCRLSSMERAVLFLYDDSLRRVRARGFHGVAPGELADHHVTLEDAPIAQRALAGDRVVEVSEHIDREVPPLYAETFGITTLTCTPLSAARYWIGVIFADRGGGRFELTETERNTMWTVGKVAALAASARIATRQQDQARQLWDRIDLARELHERAVQKIFGLSLALGSDRELTGDERARCQAEAQAALGELRTAMARPLAPRPRRTSATLRDELDRLAGRHPDLPISVTWEADATVPPQLEPLAQSVLGEALRNARKHAEPSRVDVRVGTAEGNLLLEVVNDGADARGLHAPAGTGMGLRIAALEALQHGGVVEFGAAGGDAWRVRLTAPLAADRT